VKYQVIKSFIDVGDITRNVGDIISVDGNRVGKLLQYRLIGLVKETATKKVEVEKAVIEAKEIKELSEIYPESKTIQVKAKEIEAKEDKPKSQKRR
jgi:hypothetical protein